MNEKTVIIIWLSIQLSGLSWLYVKAESRKAYLQGQADLYQQWTQPGYDVDDGPYVKGPHKKGTK